MIGRRINISIPWINKGSIKGINYLVLWQMSGFWGLPSVLVLFLNSTLQIVSTRSMCLGWFSCDYVMVESQMMKNTLTFMVCVCVLHHVLIDDHSQEPHSLEHVGYNGLMQFFFVVFIPKGHKILFGKRKRRRKIYVCSLWSLKIYFCIPWGRIGICTRLWEGLSWLLSPSGLQLVLTTIWNHELIEFINNKMERWNAFGFCYLI